MQGLNLARAFGVAVPKDVTRDELTPLLVAAEKQGLFRQPPIDYRAWAKALQDPDNEPHPRPWELVGLTEDVWMRSEGKSKVASNGSKVFTVGNRQWMLKRAKELELKMPFGVKNDVLIQALKDAGEEW